MWSKTVDLIKDTNNVSLLIGGKLGDFIHSLIIPKYLFENFGIKSSIYIRNHAEEVFASGLDNSYNELYPMVMAQDYVNEFHIYDPHSLRTKIDYDLTGFRKSERLYTTSWNEFYLWEFIDKNIKIPFNYSWLKTKNDETYKDLLLINRNFLPMIHENAIKFYENYIEAYEGKAYYVCSYLEQYNAFPLKEKVPMIYLPKLTDMVTAIGSCKHFIGNLTATAAIASATNRNRTIEIFSDPIRWKYIHEMVHYDNLVCFDSNMCTGYITDNR